MAPGEAAIAVKAAREGKQQTSWIAPNQAYESGLESLLLRLLEPRGSQLFLESFAAIAGRAALIGALKSLVQVALKITAPGIPDFHQDAELWDLSLVDPDNRRAVDFGARAELLRSFERTINWQELIHEWPGGRIKFALTIGCCSCVENSATCLRMVSINRSRLPGETKKRSSPLGAQADKTP